MTSIPVPHLQAPRLVLRSWRDGDRAAFAAMNADPRVVEHLPGPLSREESEAMVDRIREHFEAHGFGRWAIEVPGVSRFVGFVGLSVATFEAPFTPAVEIGWRLSPTFWGRGYATEAAHAALTFAFETLGLDEVVSFTVAANTRSSAVMRALGMQHDPADDFDHPELAPGHRLRRHVLYRISRGRWTERTGLTTVGTTALDRARALASALDADHFERARASLAPSCVYEVRGAVHDGPDAILGAYAEATRRARARFENVRYESLVEPTAAGARVLYTDVIEHAGEEHRHRCVQHLTIGPDQLVERVEHEDLAGEGEALQAFIARTASAHG